MIRSPPSGTKSVDELSGFDPRRLQFARTGVLAFMASALFLAYLTRHSLALVNTTMQQELGINNEQFGWLVSAFSTGYLLCQIPGGWMGQRFGSRSMLGAFAVLWSVMTSITALVGSLSTLICVRFVFGLAQAGLVPNQAQVVKDWFPEQRRASASSVLMAAMQVGGLASLALTGWIITFWNWRTVFHMYGLIGILWGGLFFWFFRTTPGEMRWLRDRSAGNFSESPPPVQKIASGERIPWGALLQSQSFWGLAGQAFFKAAGYNFIVTFFPAMLEFAFETPREMTGTLASGSMIGLVLGSLVGGWTIDSIQRRTNNKRISRCGVAAISLVGTGCVMLAVPVTGSAWNLAVLMGAAAFVSGFAQSPPWAAIIDIGGKQTAVAMGFMNCASSLPGIVISPLAGKLMDHIKETDGDWNLLIYLHAAFYLAAAVCWLFVNPYKSIEPPHTGTPESVHAV